MVYDHNLNYTADFIYNKIRSEISNNCILWHGSAFSFFSSIQFVYYEKYEKNSGVWQIAGDSYQKQSAIAVSNAEAAIRKLPQGIQAELLIKITNDQRENSYFFEDRFETGIIYTIKINVEESYSKEYYASITQGFLIHAIEINDTFKMAARTFYDRIKENRMDIVKKIGGEIYEYFHGDNYHFVVYSDEISIERFRQWRFEKYGMAALPSMEAVYGLAMVVIEFLVKGMQDTYQLLYNQNYIEVKKGPDTPSVLQEW